MTSQAIGKLSSKERIVEIILETALILGLSLLVFDIFIRGSAALWIGLGLSIWSLARIWFEEPLQRLFDFAYKWRWVIALVVFGIGVALQIHMSNVGTYTVLFESDPSATESILFGQPRDFRTDEYNVQLPYFFSQAFNGYREISYQMSVGGQNMILGYNAPVWDLTLIGKPFVWGYLLLGNSYGLSWYFLSKTILMFMVSLEMFFILTKSRHMAVFGAFLFTFAPANVWWFSPHFYDVIFWACALFVVGYFFFARQGLQKWGFVLLSIGSLTGFVLPLFPSLQVPCGVLMLCLMLACLYRDRATLSWPKSNWWTVLAVLVGIGIVLGPTLWRMKDALMILLHTEYPGSRVSVGGYGEPWMLFVNIAGIFQPFVPDPGYLNNSEISTYTHFGIAFLLFYPYLWWYLKKNHNSVRFIGDVFVIALCLQMVFLFVPFPEWLAKGLLLSMCNRMQTVFGLTASIFTIWMFGLINQESVPHKALVGGVICVLYGILSLLVNSSFLYSGIIEFLDNYGHRFLFGFTIPLFYGLAIAFAFGLWLCFTKWKELMYCALLCWTAVSGLLVNPIMQGSAAITDYPLAHLVQEKVAEDPDANWLSLGLDQIQGLLLANGAKVLNAVDFYPDFEKWQQIDPDLQNFEAINRYAHIEVSLTLDETTIQSTQPDLIELKLNVEDLKKWNVRYLVGSIQDQAILEEAKIPYEVIFEEQNSPDSIVEMAFELLSS